MTGPQRRPEIAGGDALHEAGVLDEQRTVQAETGPHLGDVFRRCAFAEHHLGGVARQHVEHREDDDRGREQGEDEAGEALGEEEADGRAASMRRFL